MNSNDHGRGHAHARGIVAQQQAVRAHLATCKDPVVQQIHNAPAEQSGVSAVFGAVSSSFTRKNAREVEAAQAYIAESSALAAATLIVDDKLNMFAGKHGRSFTIAVMQTKGGAGKTPVSVSIAVHASFAARIQVTFMEINENDGTALTKLGTVREGHALITDVAKDTGLIDTSIKLVSRAGKHPQVPVYSILSDPVNENYNGITLRHMVEAGKTAQQLAPLTVFDTGNGLATNEAAFLLADVVLVPMFVEDDTTFETAITTLINLWKMGHSEKVANNVRLVVPGVKDDRDVSTYMKKLLSAAEPAARASGNSEWKNDPQKMLEEIGVSEDKINVIAYSSRMKEREYISVLPDEMGIHNIIDTLNLLVSCLDMPLQSDAVKQSEIERRIKESEAGIAPPTVLDELTKASNMTAGVAKLTADERKQLLVALAQMQVDEEKANKASEAAANADKLD